MIISVYRKILVAVAIGLFIVSVLPAIAQTTRTRAESECVNDTWYCTFWSTCTEDIASRSCRLLFDCPNADDPMPPVTQSCAAPCTADAWECTAWSGCGIDGAKPRTCTITDDCPDVETPEPSTSEACAPTPQPTPKPSISPRPTPSPSPTPLPCNLTDLKERIRCRLRSEKISATGTITYLPEDCRAVGDSVVREQCFKTYQQVRSCRRLLRPSERITCIKKILQLGDPAAAKTACTQLPADEQSDCRNTLRNRVFTAVVFRFDDLAYRAQALISRGASESAVVNAITSLEEAKIRFNLAVTLAERKTIIQDVQKMWRDFIYLVAP